VVKALPLNFSNLPLAYAKPLDHEPVGLCHVHLAILGVHNREKNLLASRTSQLEPITVCRARQNPSGPDQCPGPARAHAHKAMG